LLWPLHFLLLLPPQLWLVFQRHLRQGAQHLAKRLPLKLKLLSKLLQLSVKWNPRLPHSVSRPLWLGSVLRLRLLGPLKKSQSLRPKLNSVQGNWRLPSVRWVSESLPGCVHPADLAAGLCCRRHA
jgi:hypothetical protein